MYIYKGAETRVSGSKAEAVSSADPGMISTPHIVLWGKNGHC